MPRINHMIQQGMASAGRGSVGSRNAAGYTPTATDRESEEHRELRKMVEAERKNSPGVENALHKAHMKQVNRGCCSAVLMLVFFMGFGTVVYSTACGWPWADALYFVLVTSATVGYGDLTPTQCLGPVPELNKVPSAAGFHQGKGMGQAYNSDEDARGECIPSKDAGCSPHGLVFNATGGYLFGPCARDFGCSDGDAPCEPSAKAAQWALGNKLRLSKTWGNVSDECLEAQETWAGLSPYPRRMRVFTVFYILSGVLVLGFSLAAIGARVMELREEALELTHKEARKARQIRGKLRRKLSKQPPANGDREHGIEMQRRGDMETGMESLRKSVTRGPNASFAGKMPANSPLAAPDSHDGDLPDKMMPQVMACALALMALLFVSSCVFSYMEDWTLEESLYFSVVTVAVVGYGDYHPTHQGSKIVCIVLLFVGCLALAAASGYFVELHIGHKEKLWLLNQKVDVGMILDMDIDLDGRVDWGEFVQFYLTSAGKVDRGTFDALRATFDRLDKDRNGFLEMDDIGRNPRQRRNTIVREHERTEDWATDGGRLSFGSRRTTNGGRGGDDDSDERADGKETRLSTWNGPETSSKFEDDEDDDGEDLGANACPSNLGAGASTMPAGRSRKVSFADDSPKQTWQPTRPALSSDQCDAPDSAPNERP